jgi:crotonobetainyl-CoA:carnitine CoA-transferase CaiB-like acyl-CoA transferase
MNTPIDRPGRPHVLDGFPLFGALQGLTVVDTGTVVAAPFACELAAEAGAQVIRISLPDPDILELSPYRLHNGEASVSTWWAQENRNKLDMVLDLTMPESKEILGALLARADIWIESSRPGTYSERLGLTDEWALGNNPRLVVVHVSGFGQDGDPGTFMRASYDVIGQAFSGFMGINGDPDGPPMKSNPYANDYVTALFALWSALAAYISVQRTGRGQVVDVAQYECQFKLLACVVMDYLMLGEEHPRTGNNDPSGLQPYGIYPTGDGYISIGAMGGPFLRLKQVVPGLDQDKLQTIVDQIVHAEEIRQLVVDWLADRSADEAQQILNAHNIPCSKVMAVSDIARNPHYRAREMLIEWDDDIGGTIQGTGLVPKFSGTPSRVWRGAPTRGKDTEAVLDWLGYDESRIAALRKTGVVG